MIREITLWAGAGRDDSVAEFRWIDWNLQKIDNHALSPEEVEFAWRNRTDYRQKKHPVYGPSSESIGVCPSGRVITIVWRYNQEGDEEKVFVITAF